jgi:hypothetical protein
VVYGLDLFFKNLKKLDPFTRITNGIIERFWLFRKNRFKTKVHPALYVSQTLAAAIGQAKTFVEKLKKIEVDLSNSESDDDVNDIYSHKDTWNRRAESKNVILLKRKKNEGFYQKNKVIVLSKNNQPIPVRFAASAPTLQVDTQIDMPVDTQVDTQIDMPVDTQFQTQQPIEVSPSSNDSSKIEILSKISDIELLESDFKTIEGNNRLNDSVILAFMKSFKKDKNVFVLPTTLTHQIVTTGKLERIMRKNLSHFDYIAGPLFISSQEHWCLLFVSVITSEITYINPLGTTKTDCKNILDNWKLFVKSRVGLKDKDWKITRYSQDHSLQQDNFSCGVFICYFYDKLINREFQYLRNFFDLSGYRIKIREILLIE